MSVPLGCNNLLYLLTSGWWTTFEKIIDQIDYIVDIHHSVTIDIPNFHGIGLVPVLEQVVDQIKHIRYIFATICVAVTTCNSGESP